MNRLAISLTAALSLGALTLTPVTAQSQIATGNGPLDITSDMFTLVNAEHMVIYTGNVQAVQNGSRLVTDKLNVYFSGKPATSAAAKPAPAANAVSAGPTGGDWGDVERLVADGHVYYASPDQTARGDHAVYEAAPDTITMTGNVVVLQGQNVGGADKLVVELKTNNATMMSNDQGRNRPNRVRMVIYNSKSDTAAAPPPAAAGSKAPAKQAKP